MVRIGTANVKKVSNKVLLILLIVKK